MFSSWEVRLAISKALFPFASCASLAISSDRQLSAIAVSSTLDRAECTASFPNTSDRPDVCDVFFCLSATFAIDMLRTNTFKEFLATFLGSRFSQQQTDLSIVRQGIAPLPNPVVCPPVPALCTAPAAGLQKRWRKSH